MDKGKIFVGETNGNYLIRMRGDVRVTLCASLNHYVESIFGNRNVKSVLVDLFETDGVDSTTLGLLTKLALLCQRHYAIVPLLFCDNPGILKTLEAMSLDELFTIIRQAPTGDDTAGQLQELLCDKSDEAEARRSVLEAHRLLVEVNPQCEPEFVDLIRYLEEEVSKQS
ncbi:MAG: anti-sigma factor antagonist [Gammaproteobacteria bacterium]|nr:anti-sigma factor antagonist [Gammaproteobacteria bacterium]MBQ0840188.1 anti-sigma factor antagonist [Gammaproteobacteria bacterium]